MRARLLGMKSANNSEFGSPPLVEVVIEIPRGSFLKRGSDGHVDFVSPLPCPYNYGSIHQYIGGEGDYLDAIVLGPRLPVGTRLKVNAYGAVGLSERYMSDDKLICSHQPNHSDRSAPYPRLLRGLRTVQRHAQRVSWPEGALKLRWVG